MKRLLAAAICIMMLLVACDGPEVGESSVSDSGPQSESSSSESTPIQEPILGNTQDLDLPDDIAAQVYEKIGYRVASARGADGRCLLYYVEFEEATPLWIYDPEADAPLSLLLPEDKLPEASAIKGICWPENSQEVILIIGYRYGTVAPGGDLYRLDLISGVLSPFYSTDDSNTQITKVTQQGESLLLETATFDSNMDNPVTGQREIPMYTESAAYLQFDQGNGMDEAMALTRETYKEISYLPAQVLKVDDSGENLWIIPRYTGSTVRVYGIDFMAGVNTSWEGAYYNTSDDWVLDLWAIQPEGGPRYKVVITCFGKQTEILVSYNGKGDEICWYSEANSN